MTTMSFFAELKNRNVLRVAAAYIVNEEIWRHGLARLYAWLGNADEAFRFMRLATEINPGSVGDAAINPLYQKLHGDLRWHEVLLEIGAAPEQLATIEFDVALPE